jgi:hypothetical protein
LGAVTQGSTEAEALKNIDEVVQMIVDELQEDGLPLPAASKDDVEIFKGARVAVNNSTKSLSTLALQFPSNVPGSVKYPNDLQRLVYRIINNHVFAITKHSPESNRQFGQVLPLVPSQGSFCQKCARVIDRFSTRSAASTLSTAM